MGLNIFKVIAEKLKQKQLEKQFEEQIRREARLEAMQESKEELKQQYKQKIIENAKKEKKNVFAKFGDEFQKSKMFSSDKIERLLK